MASGGGAAGVNLEKLQGGYCIENTSPGTVTYHKSGPSSDIRSGSC
jgi:hypothetical protein